MKKTIFFLVIVLGFSCPSIQAKMSMGIISRNIRSHEEKPVVDNEEKKKVAEPAESTALTEATEAKGPAVVTEVGEVAEAVEVIEAGETAETEGVTEAVEVTEAAKAEEAAEMTEVTKTVEVSEISEATEATEVTEPTETGSVDYEALGFRSVELNPNDYPDEVIALLEPHKNNENNNSVLFYSSLGLAYKSKGRLSAAIAAYKRALKLVSNVPAPAIQYNLGIAYYYNNELPESLNYLLKSSVQRPDHPGTNKWIKHLSGELDICKAPDISNMKRVFNKKINVNKQKSDRESRLRMYITQDGDLVHVWSVKNKIYSYGIGCDTKKPKETWKTFMDPELAKERYKILKSLTSNLNYIIIDTDGDGSFDNVINTKGKFGVPTWAYNPD